MTKTDGKKVVSGGEKTSSRVNPYVGPRPYLPGEELFGRDREKRDLFDQLLAERIVLLHSPSGAGKSSLVNAGLIPMLRQEGLQDLPVVRVGEEPDLKHASQDGFNRFTYSMLLSLEGELTPGETNGLKVLSEVESDDTEAQRKARLDELARMSLETYLVERRQKLDIDLSVLIFDQFEEIITIAPTDYQGKQVFFNQMGDILSDRSLWALFVIRDDFLGALEPFALSIPTQFSNTFRLELLNSHAAQQAIQKPVARQGITFLESAAQKLVDDLRIIQTQTASGEIVSRLGLYVEPVQLQVVCLRLYEQLELANRPEKTQIVDEDIKNVGDVGAALASYYNERVTATAGSLVVERLVRDWFDEHLITKSGLRSQVMMEVGASGGLDNALIRQLEKAHLVRAEKRRGLTWFELAHDRLVRPVQRDNERWQQKYLLPWQLRAIEWQKIGEPDNLLLRGNSLDKFREWADEHPVELNEIDSKYLQSSLKWREMHLSPLQRKAAEWDSQGRPQHLLSSGVDLQQASDWSLANTNEITTRELEYLEASREADREAVERELEAAEQLAEAERRRAEEQASAAVRLRRMAYLLGAFLVIAVILAGLAFLNYQSAQRNSQVAQRNAIIAQEQRSTAEVASTQAIIEKDNAEAAEGTAVYNAVQAEQNADRARALSLSAQASNLLDQNLDLGLLLSIEGYRLDSLPQTRQALFWALSRSSWIDRFLSGHSDTILGVAWSQDERFASGSADGTVVIWNLNSGVPEQILEGHSDWVQSVAWSPDGRLASGSNDGTIILWDLENGSPEQTLEGNSNRVSSVAWSPDGRLASGLADGTVILWDLENDSHEQILDGHSDLVHSVAWSSDGRLASGSYDGKVIVWDLEGSLPELTLEGHSFWVNSVAWSSDGRLASGSDDGTVILWDLENGSPEQTLEGHSDWVSSVAWSPDGRLASGSGDGTVIIWDWESGIPDQTLEGESGVVYCLTWSPDGRLASGSKDGKVIVWDLENILPEMNLEGHSDWVNSVAWSPDGRLASGSNDGTVIVWNPENGLPELNLEGHSDRVRSVAWSLDGKLASGSDNGTVIFWDLESGSPEMTLEEHSDRVSSVDWSPDGRLASGSYDGKVIVWDLESGLPELNLEGHSAWVNSVDWSPDGRLASGSNDGKVIIWDLESGLPELNLDGHSDWVNSVAWSLDGQLASGSSDRYVIIWDLENGSPEMTLEGHSHWVRSVIWSRDRRLASGSNDGTIIVWDLENGSPELTLEGHSDAVHSVAWSPDGRLLASGSTDQILQVWSMDTKVWINQACQRAGRNFTQAEWAQFLPEEVYRKTCEQWTLDTSNPTLTPTP
jgi:WD40 repeat protein